MVAHAVANVPFYSRWLAGVEPGRIQGPEDLLPLPLVAKRDLRRVPREEWLARGADRRRLLEFRTSGSTGEPFNIYRSLREDLQLLVFVLRSWRELGVRVNDRSVRVASSQDHGGWRAEVGRRLRGFWRLEVNCRQAPGEILAALRRHDPTVLNGYPGVLEMLAQRQASDGGRPIRPRLVLTGGEELSPATRAAIAAGFGATVWDLYATYELGVLAWECPRTHLYHVCDDSVALEVLRDGQPVEPGEEGDVVVTGLHSYAMPFVRYRLGDRAVRGPAPCPCGQPFSTLERIRGRAVDYLRLPGGRLVHHYNIMSPAMRRAGVRQWIARYQIVQEREDLVVLRLALLDTARREEFERLREEVRAVVGPGVEVRLEFVDELAFEPSGKFRLATSKVVAPE